VVFGGNVALILTPPVRAGRRKLEVLGC
jgi:hypothetical protein